jgi:hypothetical protein
MSNAIALELVFDAHSASIEGRSIVRPSHVSPSQWLDFWESLERYARGWRKGHEDGWRAAFADAGIDEEDEYDD